MNLLGVVFAPGLFLSTHEKQFRPAPPSTPYLVRAETDHAINYDGQSVQVGPVDRTPSPLSAPRGAYTMPAVQTQ